MGNASRLNDLDTASIVLERSRNWLSEVPWLANDYKVTDEIRQVREALTKLQERILILTVNERQTKE